MRIIARSNGRSHWYADEEAGGERVPGVTKSVGDGLPKPALLNWAGDATAEGAVDNWDELSKLSYSERLKRLKGIRYEKRDAAANKGKTIHVLAQRLIAGEKVKIPATLEGYVQSCVAFLNDFDLVEKYVEAVVYSETHRYAGRLDLLGDVLLPDSPEYDYISRAEDGYSTGLFDWKSGRSGIFGDVAMQLAPYRWAEKMIDPKTGEVIDMPTVDFCAGIHLRADGYSLVPLVCERDQLRDFLYIREVARIQEGLRDLVGEPIIPPTGNQYVLSRVDDGWSEGPDGMEP